MAQKTGKPEAEEKEFGWIRTLAGILNETGLTEIELEKADVKVRVARGGGAVYAAAPAAPLIAAAPAGATAPADDAPKQVSANAVTSPMVGTVYLSPSPGADAFVKEGARVTEGQTLMIIEAMKTMNAVAAPKSGVVSQILVRNEQPVEFGEPLIVID